MSYSEEEWNEETHDDFEPRVRICRDCGWPMDRIEDGGKFVRYECDTEYCAEE